MAKTTPPSPQPANLSLGQIKAGIPKLKRRLEEIRAFDPLKAATGDNDSRSIIDKLHTTMGEVFGHGSVEYNRYFVDSFYSGGIIRIGGGPTHPTEKAASYTTGKKLALGKVETAIAMLQEQLDDAVTADGAGLAPLALDGTDLHPAVQIAAGRRYRDGHYADAVEAACKSLNALVQARSGEYDLSDTALMNRAFSTDKPLLTFNSMNDDDDKGEQLGMQFLYKGAFLAFRNKRAHNLIEDDAETAYGIITFISFLAKMLDKSISQDVPAQS